MALYHELQSELFALLLLVVLFSVVPQLPPLPPPPPGGDDVGGSPDPEDPDWKKYLKWLAWFTLATAATVGVLYLLGYLGGADGGGGSHPPSPPSAPPSPPPSSSPSPLASVVTLLESASAPTGAPPSGRTLTTLDGSVRPSAGVASLSDLLDVAKGSRSFTQPEQVYEALEKMVSRKSNRELNSAMSNKLAQMTRIPGPSREGLADYVHQRLVETCPQETRRVTDVARAHLDSGSTLTEAYREALLDSENRHGKRLYKFAIEYRQKR